MKDVFLISSVVLSALLVSCTSKSVAGDYKSKLGTSDASAVGSGDEESDGGGGSDEEEVSSEEEGGGSEEVSGEEETTGTEETGGGESTAGAAGNATAGEALLGACAACHKTGGLGGSVTLDATAVAKLDNATKDAAIASNHTGLPAFEAANRADVTAALKAR